MDNAQTTVQQPILQATSPSPQPSQQLRFRHSCENCRRRKIKCTGTRPICEHCQRRGIDCIYKPLARSTRRSTSVLSSPAMSVSSATGAYGFPRQPHIPSKHARAKPGQPQPISIPMSGGSMPFPYAMPLHLMHHQGANAQYASAPTNSESPYLQAAYYQQQTQFKQQRPATAIPPHLCNVSGIGGGSMSPLGSPQMAYMYGSLPTDLGSSLGSYNSMQSDGTDLASPSSMQGVVGGGGNDPMNFVNISSSAYDVQIPGSPAVHQQQAAAVATFASARGSGGGMSPAPSPLASAAAGFGLPTQIPVPKRDGDSDGHSVAGRARTYTAETSHRRTMTDESADSISNVPLLERSTFGDGSFYDPENRYPPNSAMSVDFNPQHEQHYSLPSDMGMLFPGVQNSDGSVLECNSQAYIDLISSYGLSPDPTTVAAASAANYSMLLDSKLGGWESQQQQPSQQQHPSSSLMSGIAPELTMHPPPPPPPSQQPP
ncbi:hypothetical protein GGI20_005265 [Coemansia sp. BCRC 34301]|nr:hypothetical protein GGI20_005265 [Coemansia sp. BCRC 34301]